MRISDWSSDVCSSDLIETPLRKGKRHADDVALGRRKLPFVSPEVDPLAWKRRRPARRRWCGSARIGIPAQAGTQSPRRCAGLPGLLLAQEPIPRITDDRLNSPDRCGRSRAFRGRSDERRCGTGCCITWITWVSADY